MRGAIREIIPEVLYQRGQILTWQREKKFAVFKDLGIKTVVNLWPKQDPDLAESQVVNYLQLSAVRSEMMLESRMETAARYVAELCQEHPTLVLCEAGKTRSVYFCILVVSFLQEVSLREAMDQVVGRIGSVSLKKFMLDRINQRK